MSETVVTVVGGGLAGSEAAFQLAKRGHRVRLVEMKPAKRTPAQVSDFLAELVCSNSFRSDNPENAVGLLHEELRRVGSLILASADEARVPAGDALAVDRVRFSTWITERIEANPAIERVHGELESLPEGHAIVATGPLTSDALARAIAEATQGGDGLYFYDAIAPIISAESIDHSIAFAQSRYGKGGGDDYLNLPLDEAQYHAFVAELRNGQKVVPHAFEEPKYFDGCLPVEVLAERGEETLAHGPMKPMGLSDPRTGNRPYAVVQLRREDAAGTSFNIVGFQTRLTWPEQRRIFRMLPGLAEAEFVRLGQIHRNTFLNGPALLGGDLSLRSRPELYFAGQIVGVEGYVESTAVGFLAALSMDARLRGVPFQPPPGDTALGALLRHVTGEAHPPGYDYQPTNITWGLFPPLQGRVRKAEKRTLLVERARASLDAWLAKAS
ncbi:methylenetetrahydrofolate--tRNA-(uracil(54)-C(5))-methyltransferase (FADH(2)-oxidizing) TrmFO [Vulgatibacter incomptus]|uniref:Methylenetetrahydrofolate--tRNA-(uracil-5-)-methyltransferase TrmFO n=1 Tax=Vulgatibacter incomptus TaxID=1391653 RepID=A0A0K1PB49_9BACT|nr:methylenetetrahydrofolate--tRNA-(uracil(54)-C(5))-methyltransferase (FADH(2)-oxidizing) TrmFO [Vulgatibacter incomptus]AKU90740.1 tRNA:m(5)U-54 MTase gid [Vulgatibacter incomptus]